MRSTIIALFLLFGLAWPAAAQEVVAVGTVETVGTPENPASCVVTTANNESVWPGNVLILSGAGVVTRVGAVEDVAQTVTSTHILSHGLVAGTVELAEGNRTSLEFSVACTVIETTTTTEEETTTTSEPEEETTTTTEPDEPTTSSPPPPPTTQPPPPPTVSTTTPPDPGCPDNGLACTGTDSRVLLASAAGLLVLGVAVTSTRFWFGR